MFVGRTNELNEMNRLFYSNTFQLFVLYGRRRVGKTTLLTEFCRDKPSIFFSAENSTNQMNLIKFSQQIFSYFDETALEPFGSWENAFLYIEKRCGRNSLAVIIDEFPYLAENDKSLLSVLQHLIDHRLKDSRLFLVLCGSYMGFMEREVLGSKSPIFGRRTAQLHLKTLDYYAGSELLPSITAEEQLTYYGIFGGTPLYLSHILSDAGIEENLKHNYFSPTGYLYEEPTLLLQQELREPGVYRAIIEAIAGGAVRLNEIHQRTGEERSKCAKYISVLIELGILYREVPFGERENSRKGLYQIEDNMFRFWHRFVGPNKTLIETGAGDIVIAKRVLPDLPDYMGGRFEEICRQFLLRKNRLGQLPILFTEIGRWWGTDSRKRQETEIDLVARDGDTYLFCECKWRAQPAGLAVLEDLVEKSQLFHTAKNYYAIFSKSGFHPELAEEARKRGNVLLYGMEELMEPGL